MATKHTPGPWRRYQKRNVVAIVIDDGTDREIIHWSGFDSSDFKQDERANARLIAAAPDLLEALKRLMLWSVGGNALTKHQDVYAQARAAVEKAEGVE